MAMPVHAELVPSTVVKSALFGGRVIGDVGSEPIPVVEGHSAARGPAPMDAGISMSEPPLVQIMGLVANLAILFPVVNGANGESISCVSLQLSTAVYEVLVLIALAQQALILDDLDEAFLTVVLIFSGVLGVLETLELLNGFGLADDGQRFRDRAEEFSVDILDILNNASATDWSGAAATLYEAQNARQRDRVESVVEADRRIADIIKAQARQVEQAREWLVVNRMMLVSGMAIVTGLVAEFVGSCAPLQPLAGFFVIEKIFDWTGLCTFLALTCALGVALTMIVDGASHHQELRRAKRQYCEVSHSVKRELCHGLANGTSAHVVRSVRVEDPPEIPLAHRTGFC